MKNKTCVNCNKKLSINKFYKSKITKDKIDYYCKECRKSSSLKSHRFGTHKPECNVENCQEINYAKGLCRIHYERVRRHGSTNLKNNRKDFYGKVSYKNHREYQLNKRFKLSTQKYEEMAKDGCEICGKRELPHKKLHVDHDHKCCPIAITEKGNRTGYNTCGLCVRGVVCDKCNAAIGKYERGTLRPEYPNKDKIIFYVAKYDWLISDRIEANDKEQRNR